MINGDPWTAELLPKATYEKINNKTSLACTSADDRAFEFKAGSLSMGVCIHETFHAYHSYLFLNSVHELSINDHEEIIAEFLESRIHNIIKTAEEIYNGLKGSKK